MMYGGGYRSLSIISAKMGLAASISISSQRKAGVWICKADKTELAPVIIKAGISCSTKAVYAGSTRSLWL